MKRIFRYLKFTPEFGLWIAGTRRKTVTARNTDAEDAVLEETGESNNIATQEDTEEVPRASRKYHDTTAFPFLERRRRPVADEQFGKFVEVTKKFYGNISLLDTMQVPTYAKYLKDILGNKRVLPTTEVDEDTPMMPEICPNLSRYE